MRTSQLTAQRLKRPLHWAVLGWVLLGAPGLAGAAEHSASNGVRTSFGLGVGMSSFSQKDSNHELAFSSVLAGTVGAQLGFRVHYVFLEYAPVIFYHPDNGGAHEVSYFSYLSGNAGVALPLLPLDAYAGFERGRYSVTYATNGVFGGNTLKLGAVVHLSMHPDGGAVQLRGEFRRFYGLTDDSGSIPSDVHTTADIFMVSICIGLR